MCSFLINYLEILIVSDPNAPILTDEQISELSSAIINTSKTIEMYIKSLPGIEETEEEQLKKIAELEKENNELGNMIIEKVKDAGKNNSHFFKI